MAQTLEQHDALVLASNPTPTPVWYLYSDHPAHEHDDYAVGRCEMVFGGNIFTFEVHASIQATFVNWYIRLVTDPFGPRPLFLRPQRTWTECEATFLVEWERICGADRHVIAGLAFARETLTEAGLVAPVAPVPTSATATLAGIGPNSATLSHWTLAPMFEPDTFDYAFAAANDTFLPVVTLGFAGQAVFWKYGDDAYEGISPTIPLNSGENVIKIIVVAQDGENVKTYTLTVTR